MRGADAEGARAFLESIAGAVAGARHSTTAMRAISDRSKSAIPSFGYPVTYALSTVVFLIYGYLAMVLS